jgi:cytochrome c-type biogenesis protein CcsB
MSATHDALERGFEKRSLLKSLSLFDGVWAVLIVAGAVLAYAQYGAHMDAYDGAILAGAALGLIAFGWAWKPMRALSLAIGGTALFALWLYSGNLAAAETNFFLKYLISSQSAIMWMSALYVLATLAYFGAVFARSPFTGQVATALTWTATGAGLVGLLVRWRESYMLGPEIGYIPVSNLYEVFILFAIITAMLYLYYEGRYRTRAMGPFALLIISAAVAFLLWYTFDRQAHEIQPLVPALQSYWMKLHVPTNFIGYGAFALAAMLGVAQLLRGWGERRAPQGVLATRLPPGELLDDVMYKAIALGFAFFTIATILGAWWAAAAWGGYWSWDPKETWALIVWLNYAAWLHMRFTKGWRGAPMAWWAVIGLFITLFAFLGVNMFLSGLHSYGGL